MQQIVQLRQWALFFVKSFFPPILWVRSKCLKATESLRSDNLLLTTNCLGAPDTHFSGLGRVRTELTLQPPVDLNPDPMDWELWIMPLLLLLLLSSIYLTLT